MERFYEFFEYIVLLDTLLYFIMDGGNKADIVIDNIYTSNKYFRY